MQKKDGNFWLGLAAGAFFFRGKKKNNSDADNKGGCLYLILWLGLIILCFTTGWTVVGIILALPLLFSLSVGIIKTVLTAKNTKIEEMLYLYENKQYTAALEIAEKYSNKNRDAAFVCGMCCFYGDGCNRDYDKAFNYFKYAKKGNNTAGAYYNEMLVYGVGCTQDTQTGINGLIVLAATGEIYAKLRLGELQVKGELMPINLESGMKNLRAAAEAGAYYADYLLGMILYHGDNGVPQDIDKGLEKLQNAADNGVSEAKEFLAKMNL